MRGLGKQVKRETALVSYNDLDAWHSFDGVILSVSLQSYDAHLSVTFITDMQLTLSFVMTPMVHNICRNL